MDAARRFWARWTGNSAAIGLIAVAGGGLVLAGWPEWGAGLAILAGLWALARARFRPDASVETRLRAALERTDVGVCLYDRDDRVVALTRAFWGPFVRLEDKNFVGRHYDDMMRAVYDAGYFPESLKGKVDFEQRIAELKRARRSGSGVPRLVEIEGRWYQLTDHLTDDGGMMTVRTDITDAKRAEIRLQEAIDAMDGGFALWDAEDRLVLVNRAFERMYGKLSKEESIGRTFSELQVQAYEAGYYPQFPNLAAFDFWLGKVVHQRRSEPGIPRQNRTSAGHWYQTIESRTADGGLATITTDITDTKQAEERLRDAIENIDSGFCLYGPDGKVVLHNAKFLEPYPELAIEGVIGRSMVENVRYLRAFGYYPEYKTEAEFEALLVRVAEFQRNPPSEPQIFEPKPGMWVQNFYHRTANGGMVTIRVDITALKRAEARLRDAIESLDSGFCLFGADGRVVMHNAKYLEPYPELKARGAIGYTFVENLRFIRGHGAYPEAKTEAEFEKLVARLGADFSDPADDPIVIQVKPGFWAQVHHRRTADGGLVLIRTDISAIKQAEARLRDAIESLDSGFCLFGADGRVVMHNAKYLEPYPELKARGAIGYTFVENLRFIRGHGAYPEYKTEAEFEALVTRAEILLRDPPAEPTVVQPKPGFWIQTHYHRTADGGLVTIRTDISAIKQAEARLRDAIESLDSGFCLFDAADRVVLHNSILLESYPELMDKGMLGFTFEQNLRRAWATGRYYPQCKTEAEFEAFVAQQIRYRTDPPSEPAILELQPGRWIQYHMRRTADGGLVTIRTDISAIKQAEAAARLAEVRLRDAIESLDSGVCLFAHDGRITLHNSKYLAPYQGLAETSVIGLTFDRLFRKLRAIGGYPDIKTEAEFEAFVARNVEMIANPPRDPLVIQTMPGYWVQVNFRGTADGGMVMVRTDVTALKRAEARLRDAVEAMDGGFALWDADDRLSMHNAAYLAPYPTLALSGVAGRSFAELQTRLFETGSYPHFADRAAFEAWLTEQLRSRREQPGKARINRIRGRWYQTVEHRTAEGGLVAVRTDITEVRLAEARLREAIEAMDGGFALYDARDRLVMHNDRFREPYPTVVGKTIVGLTFEEFHDLLWETGHYARFADRTAFDAWFEPLKRIRRDSPGSPHVIQFANRHWYRVVDHRTADGGLVMIRTEITDLKEQQDRLQLLADDYALARDRAEAADRAKSDFLATMSHEIRTPLNGIVGLTYILARTKLEDAQRRHLEGIRTSGELLLSVVNDILDFSKLEAGRVRLEAIPFDPAAVIDLVRTTLGDLARGKGLALSVDLPDSTFALLSDPNRIGQVLLNLVGNAIKFTDKGGIKIRLLLTAGREAGQVRLRCEVIDTGIGIDAEAQSRLFQRFTQADSSTTRRFGGTGLGLAISKHIVDLMGGTIGVDSARGRGSTFWFELPLRLAEQAIAAATESAAGGKTAPRRLRILLVDDNEINRMVIAGMLGEEHELDQAENGVEALEAVKTRDHDLVLMDVQMPVMDGPAAVARIRAMDGAKAKLPIVALTANAMPGDRERYLASGFDDYVSKPVEIELLKAAIARLTGRALDLQAGVRPQAAAPLDAGQEAALAEFLSGIDSAGKPN